MTASLWMHRQLTHQATFVLKPLTMLTPAQIKSFELDGGWKRFHPGWTCLVFTGMLWCCVASTVLVPQLSTSFTEGADSMSLTGLIWVERCAEIKTAALVTQQLTPHKPTAVVTDRLHTVTDQLHTVTDQLHTVTDQLHTSLLQL